MTNELLLRALYEVLYNNLLLPRTHEIDREEEKEAFDGTTESLVRLYRDSQIPYEQFLELSESDIQSVIEKSKNLPISKERLIALMDLNFRI